MHCLLGRPSEHRFCELRLLIPLALHISHSTEGNILKLFAAVELTEPIERYSSGSDGGAAFRPEELRAKNEAGRENLHRRKVSCQVRECDPAQECSRDFR
jgi:hypothetical protein